MLHTYRRPLPFSSSAVASACLFSRLSPSQFHPSLYFPFTVRNRSSSCYAHKTFAAKLPEQAIAAAADPLPDDGPIELFPAPTPLFATSDDPTPLQTATSVLLTGAITVFLFRALRRRAKLAKSVLLLMFQFLQLIVHIIFTKNCISVIFRYICKSET